MIHLLWYLTIHTPENLFYGGLLFYYFYNVVTAPREYEKTYMPSYYKKICDVMKVIKLYLYAYEARINPIATFPGGDFVIFGQKTLQIAKSALDRVNVRRMMLELKRQVIGIADRLLFEQNNQATRDRFINLVSPRLALIQAQQGIESFRVVMDDTNNTELDREDNRLNGKIIVVPTRTIEFISIDFIITNAGVSFE